MTIESDYFDYTLARQIEEDRRPQSRAERKCNRKRRRERPQPRWVRWTLAVLICMTAGMFMLGLFEWLTKA
jgi:hypothetical protein